MKIGRENLLPTSSKIKHNKIDQQKALQNEDKFTANKAGDEIDISPEAQNLQKIHSQLEDIPDVRLQRVNELKQMINEGTYEIDPSKVATKILRESILDYFLKGN
ncbi:MAG: flagellar biosynthesis anti-sigma factor FlgM [bacterium]